MEREPVMRPLRPSRPSSRAIALAAVLLVASAAYGAGAPQRSLLLFPLKSHWLSEPLAQAVNAAISNRLSAAGYIITEARSDSPVLQLAVDEDWVPAQIVKGGNLEEAREPLAIGLGAEASLSGEVVEHDTEILLRLQVVGTISGAEAKLELTTPRVPDREAMAGKLAGEVLQALTPEFWAELGVEAEARQTATLARYTAAQTALAAGLYREAVVDFEAALLGDPKNPDYLRGSAQARGALGDYSGAAVRMRSLATVMPSDAEIALQFGYSALRAGEASQAEAAFKEAAEQLGHDPRVVEGLALSMKAQNQPARAQEYYTVLMTLVPGLMGEPDWLPALLANDKSEVRFAELSQGEIQRELGRLYLDEGKIPEGIRHLVVYYEQPDRPVYQDDDYLAVAGTLDTEAESVARAVQAVFAALALNQYNNEEADHELNALHDRSEALATLAEKMQVSSLLDPAHRYRVLAYNLLNQSNFEALMFVRTGDAERQRRSDLLRTAFWKSQDQAKSLASGLLGGEPVSPAPEYLEESGPSE